MPACPGFGCAPAVNVVLASSNRGKLAELRALLEPTGLYMVSQDALGV